MKYEGGRMRDAALRILRGVLWAVLVVTTLDGARGADDSSRNDARKLWDDQPRKIEEVRKAAQKLSAVADANKRNFDDQWWAARAWCWLGDYGANDDEKKQSALKGIEFAERAIGVEEGKAEGHYYRARSILMLADVERGLSALGRIKEAKKSLEHAIECDEKFDEGGPHRLLGLLLFDAPGWPVSIGNQKEAEKHIRRAAELFPAYPENQIALARVLRKLKNEDGARAALKKALAASPWPTKIDEDANWKETIRKALKDIEK